MKKTLKHALKDQLVIAVMRFFPRSLIPHGASLPRDLRNALPNYRLDRIFDVGANIGQSTEQFLAWYPAATIYCFEPVRSTFKQLQNNFQGQRNLQFFQLAFGAASGNGAMILEGTSDIFRLSSEPKTAPASQAAVETVQIETIDAFCQTQQIAQISLLKIDTEGHDLEVLKGAVQMLAAQRIDLVQVEAGMYPLNRLHVPFEQLKQFLEAHGYLLFGIYEQMPEWTTGAPHLRRTNPVFISATLMHQHQR